MRVYPLRRVTWFVSKPINYVLGSPWDTRKCLRDLSLLFACEYNLKFSKKP